MQTIKPLAKTGNMRRDLFELVKNKQHLLTAKMVTDTMEQAGYNPGSASTALVQMKKAGLVTSDANKRLYLLTETYRTFDNPYYNKLNKKPARPAKAGKSVGIAALAAPSPVRTELTAERVLAHISVAEAHKLYVELGKMFGGK